MYSNRPDSYSHNRIRLIVESEIANIGSRSLLDVGCAEGLYVKYSTKQGIFSVGVDIALSKLSNASNNSDFSLPYLCADVQKLPFDNESFEVVLALEVLEHVPDYKVALDEIFRVSNKYVIISVPLGLIRGSGHINFFNKTDFQSWAERYNMIKCYGILTNFMPFRRTVSLMSFKLHRYLEVLDSIFCSMPHFRYSGTHVLLIFKK